MAPRLRSQSSRTPSLPQLRFKLTRIVSQHDQLKIAFHQLKSQIKIGLLEAEDVFKSLAIPLTKLVGLKTVEMAGEGRSSTIFTASDLLAQGCRMNDTRTESPANSPTVTEGMDQSYKILKLEDEYATRATVAGNEFIQKQKFQLTQLVQLLQKIEIQVNTSQDNIFETISDHQDSLRKFFQKAITYLSSVYQSGQSHDSFLVTLKILKSTFDHVRTVLCSVESGIDDLMHELAEQMCNPMADYVKSLKAEIATGTCPRLLAIVGEMGGAIKHRRLELEEARMKMRGAEQQRFEALRRLEESEERVRKMKTQLGYFLEAKLGSNEHCAEHKKLLVTGKDQTEDEKLFLELLKKKRKYQPAEIPFGSNGFLCIGTNSKPLKSSRRSSSSVSCKPKNCIQGLSPQIPHLDFFIPLDSSPSGTTKKYMLRKRIKP